MCALLGSGAGTISVDKVGADRVTIGTDAPFDMAEDDPLAMIAAVPGLTAAQLDCIYGGAGADTAYLDAGLDNGPKCARPFSIENAIAP